MNQKNVVVDSVVTNFLTWLRRVIEEADKPLSLLIMVTLPLIAPIIPSIVTSMNLEKYMGYDPKVAALAAIVFALVGYVSMITAIGSIMRYVENDKNEREWVPVAISVGSYMVYVFALVTVNVVLEQHNGVDGVSTMVTALMTLGLEIPSALLNGTRINNRMKAEESDKYDNKEKSFELEKLRIENETKIALAKARSRSRSKSQPRSQSQSRSQSQPVSPRTTLQPSASVSPAQAEIFSLMNGAYKKNGTILSFSDLMAKGYEKSTASRYRSKWIAENPDKKAMGF